MEQLPQRRTRARIDLDALGRNLSLLKARSGGAELVLPVKADAYGHGQLEVAKRAVAEGVALLAVANLQELLQLRYGGVEYPTLILEDLFPEELGIAVTDPETRFNVSTLSYAEELSRAAVAEGRQVLAHVNVDTGMGRMGLLSEDPVGQILAIRELPGVVIEGLFTHFPAADETDRSFALEQIDRFRKILGALSQRGCTPRYAHVANSAGIIAFGQEAAFDLVRPGVSAYGMYPSREIADAFSAEVELQPVMSLLSSVVKVTEYDREWTVGYGRSYAVGPGSRIAVVPVGYGDGYRRGLSNRGVAIVHGRRVPICGRVSMDMITLDVTDLPEPVLRGDEVVLLGEQRWKDRAASIFAEEMAEEIGTISYEVTCGFTPRVPRVYS